MRSGSVMFTDHVDRIATFYAGVLGLAEAVRDDDHVRLEAEGFELVVHRTPDGRASQEDGSTRRAAAAIKPIFFVRSLANARTAVEANGGVMEPADRVWAYNGTAVCDAMDPDGNVIQFREG